jgi:hypothetical protein
MNRALVFFLLVTISVCAVPVRSESPPLRWKKSESSLALLRGRHVLWQFNYGANLSVPYFHPVSTDAGRVLTWDRPPDHAWHHGLWFCWKYINGVNYWEHDRQTGKPAGHTAWSDTHVKVHDDHSASVSMTLDYHPADEDEVVLSERRRIEITAPNSRGEYNIDWTAEFTAAQREVKLDRTPPKAQSWGGYAGLSVRFAKELSDRQATSNTGPVEFGSGQRHRSRATSMDYSGVIDGNPVGMALLDHPNNPRHPTPWYVIRAPVMGYINAALLNDQPMTLQPGELLVLRYRLIVHSGRWDAARLQTAQADYWQSVLPDEK